MSTSTNLFDDAEVIHIYTRAQAIADGDQVSANQGDLAEVTEQHYRIPVYMTSAVYETIKRAVDNPRTCNDTKGVLHDILYMSRHGKSFGHGVKLFSVIITGAGRKRRFQMLAEVGAVDIDDARPCVTIMFPEER